MQQEYQGIRLEYQGVQQESVTVHWIPQLLMRNKDQRKF